MIKDMYYYGLKSHEDVAKEIEKLSANTSGTIILETASAPTTQRFRLSHLCEVLILETASAPVETASAPTTLPPRCVMGWARCSRVYFASG